ncbi:MAG: hypothetical protein U0599_23355 [Vicinamibacteria bacterium]
MPVLAVAARRGPRRSFALAGAAWFLGGLNMWAYYRGLLAAGAEAVPGVAAVLVPLAAITVPALAFGGAAAGFSAWASGGRPWRAAGLFASAWVGYELATARLSPHGTFGHLAYSQMGFPPAVQLASAAGPWAVSLALLLPPRSSRPEPLLVSTPAAAGTDRDPGAPPARRLRLRLLAIRAAVRRPDPASASGRVRPARTSFPSRPATRHA